MVTALSLRLPSPLVELGDERFTRHGVRLLLKRDDLIHPQLRGNKWRKLELNLAAAREQGFTRLLTFGGAFSNHITATAAAGHHFGFDTVGVIRGEEHRPLNEALSSAVDLGMTLTYLDRETYRRATDPDVIAGLLERFGDSYVLPEGGSNALAVRGCAQLPAEIDVPFDVICCSCGTGGTLAGIAAGLGTGRGTVIGTDPDAGRRAIGFSALRGGEFLIDDVDRLQRTALGAPTGNWRIETDFHFGGFARRNSELDSFIEDFEARHGLVLEWVYVAKMLYGLLALTERGDFAPGTTVVAVITG